MVARDDRLPESYSLSPDHAHTPERYMSYLAGQRDFPSRPFAITSLCRCRAIPAYLVQNDSKQGDNVRDVDGSGAVDITSAKGALWELDQSQNRVGHCDHIQNADEAVAVDVSGEEWAAGGRGRVSLQRLSIGSLRNLDQRSRSIASTHRGKISTGYVKKAAGRDGASDWIEEQDLGQSEGVLFALRSGVRKQ